MDEVGVFIDAGDACADPNELILSVTVASDEPDDAGEDDGHTTGDTDGGDGFTAPEDVTPAFAISRETRGFEGSIFLRAERSGGGDGRSYTIEATVLNGDNNSATSSCVVVVSREKAQ